MSPQSRNPNGDLSYIPALLSCDPKQTPCVKCKGSHDGNTYTERSGLHLEKDLITSFCFHTGAKAPPVSKAPGHLFPGLWKPPVAREALQMERLWQLPWGAAVLTIPDLVLNPPLVQITSINCYEFIWCLELTKGTG